MGNQPWPQSQNAIRERSIEHEGTGTCAGIEITQDADNADQKVRRFPKAQKTYKLLWKAHFCLSFLITFTFAKLFDFHTPPPLPQTENEMFAQKLL